MGQFQKLYIYGIKVSELSEREWEKNVWNNNAYKILKVDEKHSYIYFLQAEYILRNHTSRIKLLKAKDKEKYLKWQGDDILYTEEQ